MSKPSEAARELAEKIIPESVAIRSRHIADQRDEVAALIDEAVADLREAAEYEAPECGGKHWEALARWTPGGENGKTSM